MSVWKKKFKNLKDFYKTEYDPEFYQLDQFQFEIDPDETLDEINTYDQQKQEEEIYKCTKSFSYFCHKYIKILHPTKGLVPFVIFKYQKKL